MPLSPAKLTPCFIPASRHVLTGRMVSPRRHQQHAGHAFHPMSSLALRERPAAFTTTMPARSRLHAGRLARRLQRERLFLRFPRASSARPRPRPSEACCQAAAGVRVQRHAAMRIASIATSSGGCLSAVPATMLTDENTACHVPITQSRTQSVTVSAVTEITAFTPASHPRHSHACVQEGNK